MERAFGAVFEVLPERGSGVNRNSRGGGKVVFGVVASLRFGAGFRARADAGGVGCFYRRDGRVGPKFRLKTNSAGLTTEDTGGTGRVLAKDRVHGME